MGCVAGVTVAKATLRIWVMRVTWDDHLGKVGWERLRSSTTDDTPVLGSAVPLFFSLPLFATNLAPLRWRFRSLDHVHETQT